MESKEYYVISYKNSDNGLLTFWRANNAGYTTDLLHAGKYTEEEIIAQYAYYNNGYKQGKKFIVDNIAVPCEEVEKFTIRHVVQRSFDTYVEHVGRIKELLKPVNENTPMA